MIDPGRTEAVIKLPCLVTKKQMRGFFKIVGFHQLWFPGSGELTKPLTEAANNENSELVTWGPEREQAFKTIKWCLLLLPGSQITQIPSICMYMK